MKQLLLILSCLIAVISDMAYVMFAKFPAINFLIIGVIGSLISISLWIYAMRVGVESSTAITYYCVLTMIGCTLLGHIIFHEQLSLTNWLGIFLAIISLILIAL